ncbi:MAG: hypothetical protein CMN87_20525 [Stappia sp.]|jgi:hypothetical protein|uniref:cell division protein FtsL n=1 Tax=Stappia sp. TaxID=1870903 RepID=UPI000C5AA3DB|nr:hypothetical protein [Stappia sp.]MAA97984.1 hypothetical protein [Stappia sp.]MBM22393.1 hypothetical protein [Stappia sp.]
MGRITNVVLAVGVLAAAASVYNMKHDAERSAEHVSALQKRIDDERERIQLLRAEWSVLNDPSRLQGLVERYKDHLHLEPLSVDQITRIEDIPIRPVELEPIDSNATLGGYAGNAAPVVR